MNKAAQIAEQLKARVVFPSDPKRKVNLYAKTDVKQTWARFKPDDCMAWADGKGTQ